jgi:flagellar biosynthesis protein FlhF
VGAAISRRGPFSAGGSLVDDVRGLIAASLPNPIALPQEHGAVALVGAGGSGKTRSVAALAAAQARAGTLVSVASLGTPGREDELGALLHGEAVNIIPAMRTRATARAVSSARERGLVIIDTAAAAPRDDSTIDVMAEALHSFGLDGIYLTVPATLSSGAAVRLVDSFSAFDLTGMVATHVDETDELGQIVELAMQTGIPLAYTLNGFALQEAVAFADPDHIAAELLR